MMGLIEIMLLFFICGDAILLGKQDHKRFYEFFNLRHWLIPVVFLTAVFIAGIKLHAIQPEQWLIVLLLCLFPFYLFKRFGFKKARYSQAEKFSCGETNLALASETSGVILNWAAGVVLGVLAIKVLARFFIPLKAEMAQMVMMTMLSSIWMLILIKLMVKSCFNPSGNSPSLFKAGMRADSRNKVSGQSLAPTALEIVSSTPVKAWESNVDFAAVLGLKRNQQPGYKIWFLPVLCGLAFATVAAALTLSRSYQPKTPFYELLASTSSSWLMLAFFVVAVVLAPFFEEVIFRGFFFYVIHKLKGKMFAVISIALVFALLHYDQYWGDWIAIAAVTLLGFILTTLRAWTGTSIASMVMHYSFNIGMTVIPLLMVFFSNPVYFEYQIHYNDLDPGQKEQFLLESIHKYPRHAASYNDLAWLYAEENNHLEDALALANQAIEIDPDNYAFLDTKAEILYKRGEYPQAIRIEEALTQRYPSDEYLHKQLEKFKRGLKDNQSASPYIKHVDNIN